jgi:hypothetical protein
LLHQAQPRQWHEVKNLKLHVDKSLHIKHWITGRLSGQSLTEVLDPFFPSSILPLSIMHKLLEEFTQLVLRNVLLHVIASNFLQSIFNQIWFIKLTSPMPLIIQIFNISINTVNVFAFIMFFHNKCGLRILQCYKHGTWECIWQQESLWTRAHFACKNVCI